MHILIPLPVTQLPAISKAAASEVFAENCSKKNGAPPNHSPQFVPIRPSFRSNLQSVSSTPATAAAPVLRRRLRLRRRKPNRPRGNLRRTPIKQEAEELVRSMVRSFTEKEPLSST
ncbi:unnamed protein product [Linum trigynum]|uniref:Uncharacterized protein n=1 Tax=Linum trigynum TaxID=586398 RepID=A0AAV2E2S5_9ROSI